MREAAFEENIDEVDDEYDFNILNDYKERSQTEDSINSRNNTTINDGAYLPVLKSGLIQMTIVHICAIYGLYLCFTSASWKTIIFAIVLQRLNMIGIVGGAHRLWGHGSFKAKLPVRIFLMIVYTSAYQLSIWHWVRDHRVHHKYVDTDADPYNTNRGLFFTHMGFILRQRHPENLKKLRNVDLSDIMADPVVRFNFQYYYQLVLLFAIILPAVIPMYFWNETLLNSFFVAVMLRFTLALHEELATNSLAHKWGSRPYDSNIKPCENKILQILGAGEGFHNYHHVFPFDYAASEFGMKGNITTGFIDVMSWFGLTYDLKTVPRSMVEARKKRNMIETERKQHN